jgi:hypothetical protein
MIAGYKTFVGALIAVAPVIASLLGYDLSANFGEEAGLALSDIITLVGGAIAIYGRLKAQTPGWLVKR